MNAISLGIGYVGKATCKALGITNYYSRSEATVALEDIHKFKYVFICLPTPTTDGRQEIDVIRKYIKVIHARQTTGERSIFIIRSTILPGTCERLKEWSGGAKIAHVPEFLTESTWEQDADWPDITVIGADDPKIREEVAGIFKQRFKGTEFFITDSKTAEMVKYAINCFYATKVIYANQIYDFCKDKGINYETVKQAMYARKWIGKNHLGIFHKGGKGAGGKCLQKDLDAFANLSNLPLVELTNKINKAYLMSFPKIKGV